MVATYNFGSVYSDHDLYLIIIKVAKTILIEIL